VSRHSIGSTARGLSGAAEVTAEVGFRHSWRRPSRLWPEPVAESLVCCEAVVFAELLLGYETDGSNEQFEKARRDEINEIDQVPDHEVREHAGIVLGFVQNELAELGGPGAHLDEHCRDYANRLGRMLYQAHEAVWIVTQSRSCAKEIQIAAAPAGVPLSICRGRTLREMPEVRYGVPGWREKYGEDEVIVSSRGDGCLEIIADSRAATRPRIYCDRCNKKGPGLKSHALASVKDAWKGNVRTITGQRNVLCVSAGAAS
jgi:hypothetical protein